MRYSITVNDWSVAIPIWSIVHSKWSINSSIELNITYKRCAHTQTDTQQRRIKKVSNGEQPNAKEERERASNVLNLSMEHGTDSKRIKTFLLYALTWFSGSIHSSFEFEANNRNAKQCMSTAEVDSLKIIPINTVIGLHYHHSFSSIYKSRCENLNF